MKNIIFLIPSLFTLSMCSKNIILPKVSCVIGILEKEYLFYCRDDDSFYASLSVNRSLNTVAINVEYDEKINRRISLNGNLPEFSVSKDDRNCLPKNIPVLNAATVNGIDYTNNLEDLIDASKKVTAIFKYNEDIPKNYMVSINITSAFLSSRVYYSKDWGDVVFWKVEKMAKCSTASINVNATASFKQDNSKCEKKTKNFLKV